MADTDVIGGYFDERLQFWVKVIRPEKDKHKPCIHSKINFRMKGSERKKIYEPKTLESSLGQQVSEFIKKRRSA